MGSRECFCLRVLLWLCLACMAAPGLVLAADGPSKGTQLFDAAAVAIQAGELDRALVLANEALQWAGKNAVNADGRPSDDLLGGIFNVVGIIAERKRAYSKAEEAYQVAIANCVTPGCRDSAALNLGTLLMSRKRYREADRILRDVLAGTLDRDEQKPLPGSQRDTKYTFMMKTLVELSEQFENSGLYDAAEWYYQRLIRLKRQKLGPRDPSLAVTFYNLALMYKKAGDYQKAWVNAKYSLEIEEAASNDDTKLNKWHTLTLLGTIATKTEQYEEAERYLQRALGAVERISTDDDPMVNHVFQSTSALYSAMGNSDQAVATLEREIKLCERRFGSGSTALAAAHSHMAELLREVGSVDKAEAHAMRALTIAKQREQQDLVAAYTNLLAVIYSMRGKGELASTMLERLVTELDRSKPDSVEFATVLNNLGEIVSTMGADARAEQLFLRSWAIWKKLPAGQSPQESLPPLWLGRIYTNQRKWGEAEPLLQRAYQLRTEAFGAGNAATIEAIEALLDLYFDTGQVSKSVELMRGHLKKLEKTGGKKGRYYRTLLLRLSVNLTKQGSVSEAEQLAKEAQELVQATAKGNVKENEEAEALTAEARALQAMGMRDQALPLFEKALAIRERVGRLPEIESARNNLGLLCWELGQLERAQKLMQATVESIEKRGQVSGYHYGSTLNNLALILIDREALGAAEGHLRKAIGVGEKALGPLHPELATWRDNLAEVLRGQGQLVEAQKLHEEVLSIYEKSLGPDHPESLVTLEAIAELRAKTDSMSAFFATKTRVLRVEESVLRQLRTEDRLHQFLAQIEAKDALNITLGLLDAQPEARRLALTTSLFRKGRSLDLQLSMRESVAVGAARSKLRTSWEALQKLNGQIDTMFWAGVSTEAARTKLQGLRKTAQQIEEKLAAYSPVFRKEELPAVEDMVPAVAAAIPKDGVLIELVVGFDPRTLIGAKRSKIYLALLLFPDQRIEVVPLGPTDAIDRAAAQHLTKLKSPAGDPLRSAQTLYRMVFAPLYKHTKSQKRIFVSPEGVLHLIPWATLHDGKRYLLDVFSEITYLTSGRDLLRKPPTETRAPALIVGAPDYQYRTSSEQSSAPNGSAELSGLYSQVATVAPLPNSRIEAEQIAKLVPNSQLLVAASASELAVRSVHGPQLLHIATHGVFMQDGVEPTPVLAIPSRRRALVPLTGGNTVIPQSVSNPLSRAALLLAGASLARPGSDSSNDGIFTAQEATSLDLFGTELVVLSACDTGSGNIEKRQGVYGLRRAFLIAGAQSLLVSLWQVADVETSVLMESYYRGLLAGQGRAEALTLAARALRKRKPHPYYWAPFVVVGNHNPIPWNRPIAPPAVAEQEMEAETDTTTPHPNFLPKTWQEGTLLRPGVRLAHFLSTEDVDADVPPVDNAAASGGDGTTNETLLAQIRIGMELSRYYDVQQGKLKLELDKANHRGDSATVVRLQQREKELTQARQEWSRRTLPRLEKVMNDPSLRADYSMDRALYESTELLLGIRAEDQARGLFKRLIQEFPDSKFGVYGYVRFAEWFLNYTPENTMKFALKAEQYKEIGLVEYAMYIRVWALIQTEDYKEALALLIDLLENCRAKRSKVQENGSTKSSMRVLRKLEVAAKSDMAFVYSRLGIPSKALPFIQKYAREDTLWVMVRLGSLFAQNGRHEASVEIFRKLLGAYPGAAPVSRCAWQEAIVSSIKASPNIGVGSLETEQKVLDDLRQHGTCD